MEVRLPEAEGVVTRVACPTCGGWVSCGTDFASWPARRDAFYKLHEHPADAPQVYRWPGSDAERDAFDAALTVNGLTHIGTAPLGGRLLVFHAKKPGSDALVRIVARTPSDLA
jgi:hypothetical protein